MRRAHSLPIAFLAATSLAGAAAAQTPGPAGRPDLRQLSWSARTMTATSHDAPLAARGDLRRPNLVIPHGGFSATAPTVSHAAPAPAPHRTLTPANAWIRPASPPPAPAAAAVPVPAPAHTEAPAPVRVAPPTPRDAAMPEYLPDQGGRGQPVPADVAYAPAPEPAPSAMIAPARGDPADPMAPRRDAPIFRLQRPAPEPAAGPAVPAPRAEAAALTLLHRVAEVSNTGERPPQQGARYYSVHRQNGRQPDVLEMPEPTYVDALAITMTVTPASQDLAQPDPGPTLIRDNQGRMRPAPAASDGDHQ